MTQSKQLSERKTHFPSTWSHLWMKSTYQTMTTFPRLDMLLFCPQQKHILEASPPTRSRDFSGSVPYLPLMKVGPQAGLFSFLCLSLFICKMRELDCIGWEVLLVLRTVDMGSFHSSAGVMIDHRYFLAQWEKPWHQVRTPQSMTWGGELFLLQLPLWPVITWVAEHFNLHPDVCIPRRESLGSYLTSALPENILLCGKGKHGGRESYCTFVCSVILPGPWHCLLPQDEKEQWGHQRGYNCCNCDRPVMEQSLGWRTGLVSNCRRTV